MILGHLKDIFLTILMILLFATVTLSILGYIKAFSTIVDIQTAIWLFKFNTYSESDT